MIWLFMLFCSVCLLICALIKDKGEVGGVALTGIVIFTFITVLMWGTGASVYPNFVGQREYVRSIESEIESIRNASYAMPNNNNPMINGSLDNTGQSVALSKYLGEYAVAKSKYNRRLKQIKMTMFIYFNKLFDNVIFIDKRVLKLEPIE